MAEHRYDLVVVGAGSGNAIPGKELAHWRIAVVEASRFGGTCLNTGCIPSKMLVHTADVAREVQAAPRFGISARVEAVDWPAIRTRVFARIDPLHAQAVEYRRRHRVDVYLGEARFVGHKRLAVGDDVLVAERFVLAAGSRPYVPPIPGLDRVDFHTSNDVMRLEALPRSMIVIGGGYIAAELGHVFGALGTAVTIVERSDRLLMTQDRDVSSRFTEIYRRRFDVRLGTVVSAVVPARSGLRVELAAASAGPGGDDGAPAAERSLRPGADSGAVEAEALLVATGRVPNSDRLDVAATGVELDEHGHVVTDRAYRTNIEGIWSLGDLSNHTQLKHLANAEARLVRHNLLDPEHAEALPFTHVPSAVFAEPQVASIGATEQQLESERRPYVTATRAYADTAYGWALGDSTGFVKLLADPQTRLLLGAHVIGPQASTLVQPLVQAMFLANTVDELATGVLYTHPALTEVVEQALLEL